MPSFLTHQTRHETWILIFMRPGIVCYPVGTAMLGESNTLNRSLNFENCYLILGCLKLPQDLMRKNMTHFPIFSMSNNWIPIFSDTPISSFYHPLIMILVILVIQHSSHGRIPILVTNSILHSVQNPLSFWIILVKNGIPIDYYCYGHPQDVCLVEKHIYIYNHPKKSCPGWHYHIIMWVKQ